MIAEGGVQQGHVTIKAVQDGPLSYGSDIRAEPLAL